MYMLKSRDRVRTALAYSVATAAGIILSLGGAWYAQLRRPVLIALVGGAIGLISFHRAPLVLLGRRDPRPPTIVCSIVALLGGGTGALQGGVDGTLFGATCAIVLGFVAFLLTVPERTRETGGPARQDIYVNRIEVAVFGLSVGVASILAGLCLRQQYYPGLVFPSADSPVHIAAIWESVTLVFRGADPTRNPRIFYQLTVPYWYALPVALLPSVLVAIRWRVRRRRVSGPICHGCGYNLTGNVSGVCPECGRPVEGELRNDGNTPESS